MQVLMICGADELFHHIVAFLAHKSLFNRRSTDTVHAIFDFHLLFVTTPLFIFLKLINI